MVTTIIVVTCKFHNCIVDNSDLDEFEDISHHVENYIHGRPHLFLQNDLHIGNFNSGRRTVIVENRMDKIKDFFIQEGTCDQRFELTSITLRRTFPWLFKKVVHNRFK